MSQCAQDSPRPSWALPLVNLRGEWLGGLAAEQVGLQQGGHPRPMLIGGPAELDREQVLAALQPVIAAYRAGNKAEAIDRFLKTACGDDYRTKLHKVVPDAFAEALQGADHFFQVEVPAVQQWSFGPNEAQRISQPVLNVLGAESVQRFVEGGDLVEEWFPQAPRLSIPGAGPLMMVENPTAVADGLREFFSRHPIGNGKTGEPLSSSRR